MREKILSTINGKGKRMEAQTPLNLKILKLQSLSFC